MAKCKRCLEKEKEWSKEHDPIQCAFDNKENIFNTENWNCWTMDVLREKAMDSEIWNQDQYASLIPYEIQLDDWSYIISYLYLEWYKSRGRTEKLLNMEKDWKIPTLEEIEKIIDENNLESE